MKCFLHIGLEKTATKSLQRFLSVNREHLLSHGLCYPKCLGPLNSVKLAVAAYHPKRYDDISLSMGIGMNDTHQMETFRENVIRDLVAEMSQSKEAVPQVSLILSSEHFHSRLTRLTELETLKNILFRVGVSKVYVIIYLRNPVELAASLYSTAIKSGRYLEIPPGPSNPYFNNLCNHKKTLENFGSVFGYEALIPKIFHRLEFADRSIFQDFLAVMQPSLSEKEFTIPVGLNESLSESGIEILKRVNRHIPRIIDDRMNPQRGNIVEYFEKYFTYPKYTLPAELYRQYEDAFRESNEWVRSRFFPGKSSLFPGDTPQEPAMGKLNDAELDQVAAMISEIWISRQTR